MYRKPSRKPSARARPSVPSPAPSVRRWVRPRTQAPRRACGSGSRRAAAAPSALPPTPSRKVTEPTTGSFSPTWIPRPSRTAERRRACARGASPLLRRLGQPYHGADHRHEADGDESANHRPRRVELQATYAELRRARVRVVVVVQRLPTREPGDRPPIIGRVVEVLPAVPVAEPVDERREHEH